MSTVHDDVDGVTGSVLQVAVHQTELRVVIILRGVHVVGTGTIIIEIQKLQ
jgi:hypothetical protein